MKKHLFLLVALFCCAAASFAQSPLVATLSHNDTVSVFYGRSAFIDAYDACTHGDVITLSSGSFDVPSTINRNITIRGAGMERDSVNKVFPTILMGEFYVYSPADTIEGGLTVEGIYHNGTMNIGSGKSNPILRNSQFIKCHFDGICSTAYYYKGVSDYWNNVKFIQCIVSKSLTMASGNPVFMNSVLFGAVRHSEAVMYSASSLHSEFLNCVLVDLGDNVTNSMFSNCAIWGGTQLSSSNVVYQCVGSYTGTTAGGMFKNLIGDLGNVSLSDSTALFKTFRGTYGETETYELTDSAKVNYLGTDGTQVGIYGGTIPYTPKLNVPQIKKFNVASKSTDEGMLKVEIEVSAAE